MSLVNDSVPALKLTVFTIAYKSASEVQRVIRELQRQTARQEVELIVVAPDRDGVDEADLAPFGASQWVTMPEVRVCGEAMERAVRAAQAPFATYAEEHSYFDERWAERLIAAHEAGYDAVGFAMENANPNTVTSWAQLYGQFGPAVAPVASGEVAFLAGHHTSYRTELLLGYGPLLSAMLEDESALFLDLRARGKRMFMAGDAVSRHINISELRAYLHMDFLGQRSFGAARARVGKWSVWKRLLYAGGTPLVPFVRLARILKHIRRTGRERQLLPAILVPLGLALTCGAWGEMLGYLFGGANAAEQRAPVELQRERYLAPSDGWSNAGD